MSEHKTEKEKLQGLLNKLYEIREMQLLTIEEIAEKTNKLLDRLDDLDKKLENAQKSAETCPVKEVRRWEVVVRCIAARKAVLSAEKMALKELRLMLTYLLKKEGALMALVAAYD